MVRKLVTTVATVSIALPTSAWFTGWGPTYVAAADDPPIEVSTTITSPADGDIVDDGVTIDATGVAGVAAGGERAVVVVLDLSGSVRGSAGGDCNGDGGNDTILTCEIEAALEVVERAAAVDNVTEFGVAVFAGGGTAADVSPESGFQFITEPDADLNGNAIPDLEEVIRSVFVNGGVRQFTFRGAGAGTNYAAGVQAACSVANEATTDNPLVVFLSDGDNLRGSNVTGQLPCTNDAEFQTFAVGTGASCTRDPRGRGSLQDIADLTGGDCTNVVSPADLPEILSESLAPDITSVTASINGGAPIDLSAFVTPSLPAPSVAISWPAFGLAPGINEICITTSVERGGETVAATDCIEVFARGGVEANAGPDQDVDEGAVVSLDGTESTGSGLRTVTWTTTDDFADGASINVDGADDRLELDAEQQAFDFIWIAASDRGTVVKIDTGTGEILGEYWSAPENLPKNPSRTTVDKSGSVWVGNRNEAGVVGGAARGSVAKIGLAENGQCVDRNDDGVIQTSTGLGDILPWPNGAGDDTAGGVTTAVDECIVEFVRTNGVNIRHVSIDDENHAWVGGPFGSGSPRVLDRITPDGDIVRSIDFLDPSDTGEAGAIQCCYGGLIDGDGIIWTATALQNRLMRIDPSLPNGDPDLIRIVEAGRTSYGLGIDPDGNIWQTNWTFGTVQKIAPDGTILGTFPTGGPSGDRGVAATPDGDVWIANSFGSSVSRLDEDGTFVTEIAVGSQPTGMAVDSAGKVWASNRSSNSASRIDPATNTVDLTVDLGAGAGPYNYSDMTGSTLTGAATAGTWSVDYDSGAAGTVWSLVDWTADVVGDGSVEVTLQTSEDGASFGPEVAVDDGLRLTGVTGRYARVTVRLARASTGESPVVYDVSLATPGATDALSYDWRLVEAVGPAVFLSSTSSPTPSFIAPDDGRYVFELTVTDGAAQSDSDRVTVTVGNLDPELAVEIGDSFAGGVTQITGSFTDAGWLDVHSATIDWGDGTQQTIEITAQGTGWGTFFGSHVYLEPGTYTAEVTLVDDDGGSSVATLASVEVAHPIAVWADSPTANRTLNWSGSAGRIEGRVHSNNELRFVGSSKTVIGETTYAGSLSADTERHIFEPAPRQTEVLERPVVIDLAEYRPGGRVSVEAGSAYTDVSDRCENGVWQETQEVLASGIYYAACDVRLNGSDIGGEITVAAEGTIQISGARPAFEPFIDGVLFVSGSDASDSIDISASDSKFLGIVSSEAGGIDVAGSDNEFYCGLVAETIDLSGSRLLIRGAACGEPDATVAGPLMVPDLTLSLAADREQAGPTETIGYGLEVTNAGARVIVPGLFGIENVDDAPATISGHSLNFERFDIATNSWVAFPDDPADVSVDLRTNDFPGVVYAADGPVGTSLEPGALATWGYQAVIVLDGAEVAEVLDPAVTGGLRAVVEFERDPAAIQLRSLYRYGADFIAAIRELGGNIEDAQVTVLLPEGDPVVLDSSSDPALTALAPQDSTAAATSFTVPTPAPRSVFETDAGYLARLSQLDGAPLVAAAFAIADGGVGRLVAPIVSTVTTEQIPIVTTDVDGASSVEAGTSTDYAVAFANVGSVDATTSASASLDGDPIGLSGAPTSLIAGQVENGSITYSPSATLAGPVSLRSESTWTDANGVTYGPLGETVAIEVLAPGDLDAALTDTLVVDTNTDGYVSPGDTVRYQATVTNRGGAALTGVVATIPIDSRTTLVGGSAAADQGTIVSGGAAGDAVVEVDIGTLAGAASVTITFEVVIDDPFPDGIQRIEVQGTVSAEGTDSVVTDDPLRPGAADTTRTTIVVPVSDVYASLAAAVAIDRDTNGIASSGDQLRYDIVVSATGSLPTTALVLDVPIGAPATLVADSVTTTEGTVVPGSDVRVEIGDLDGFGDAPVEISFLVEIEDDLTEDVDLVVQGTLTSPDIAPVGTDDQTTADADDATVVTIAKVFSGGGGSGGGSGGAGGGGAGGGGDDPVIPGDPGDPGTGVPGPSISEVGVEEGTQIAVPTSIDITLTPPDLERVTSWIIAYRRVGSDFVGVLAQDDDPGDPTTPDGSIDISGVFDPTVLPNGSYEIIVVSTSSDGGYSKITQNVVVDSDFKPGRFELAYEDLFVQFPGLPVRVLRSYDSFDKSSGDFGIGWTLDDTRFGIATTPDLANGWDATLSGCALIICYFSVSSEIDKQVYVTWPDGKVDTFTVRVNDFNGLFPGITTMYLESADDNRADAELDSNGVYYVNGQLRSGLFGIDGEVEINSLTLTVPGGARYRVSKTGGLISTTAPGGETLSYTRDGVISNRSGVVVDYIRDAAGRITEIVGPNGASTIYTYNATGELIRVDGPAGESAEYTYFGDSTLKDAIDGTGRPIRSVEYDADGRVIGVTDGNGNTVTLDSDVDGRQQIVTDAAGGYTTITTFDDRGNPIQIDEIYDGETQTTTIDWNDRNLPTRRVDPLGNEWVTDYDDAGNPVRFVDPDLNEVTYTYARRGLPATVTDQEGNVTAFAYNDQGLPVSITDALGNVETFEYDGAGRLIRRTDRGGVEASWTYGADGRISTMTQGGPVDPVTSTITWDDLGNPLTITSPRGAVTEMVYDEAGRLTSLIDPIGGTSAATYDDAGRLASQTSADGNTVTFSFDAGGRVDAATDVLGNTTTYSYDDNDRLISIVEPSGEATTFERDGAGRMIGLVNGLGDQTAFGLDPLGRVESITDPLGRSTTYTHDPFGRVTSEALPSGATWQYRYDRRGLLVETEDPLGGVATLVHDELGRIERAIDRRGNPTVYGYDAVGQLTQITDALGGTVAFAYDTFGNRTSVTDPLGLERIYSYDADGNLSTATSPAEGTTRFAYDLAGRPTSITDARGISVSTTWDPVGRLTNLGTPVGPIVYEYDEIGRRTSMTDHVGTTTWTYDATAPERVVSVASPQGTVSYGYDAIGRRTSMTQPEGTVSYDYNENGHLTELTDWTGATSTFDYDVDGLLTSIDRPNGVSSSFSYDEALRLTGIEHRDAVGILDSFEYELDQDGNRVGVTSTVGAEMYDLDELGRLRSVTYPDGQVANYTYDAAGNRLTEQVGASTRTYTYDAEGRLSSDGSRTFDYDEAGNVTRAGSDTFEWDWAGRMSAATVDGERTEYRYDGDGTRVEAVDSTGTTEFVWDRESGLPMLISDGDSGYMQLGRRPFAASGTAGSSIDYMLGDALGSVRMVTDDGGQVTASQSFDVWGAPRSSMETTFGFAGEQHDATGLIHLRARQYDPTMGRFLSADAVQPNAPGTQGMNLYGYAAGNPTTRIDPSGNVSIIEYAVVGAIVGGLIGGIIGLFTCGGSGWDYALCVVQQAGIGGLAGLVAGIVFALAFAALSLLGAGGWALYGAGGFAGGAGTAVGGYFNGGTSPSELLVGTLIGILTAGLGTWLGRTPLGRAAGQYLDDLFSRFRSPPPLRGTNQRGQVTSRPSNFRQGTLQDAWDNAAPGPNGGRTCPSCGNEVTVPPNTGVPRDWDGSHNPSWSNREFPPNVTRQQVLDDYNQGVDLECISCNRAGGNNDARFAGGSSSGTSGRSP